MGRCPVSRRAALLLLAIGGTKFTDIAAALKGSEGGSAANACSADSPHLDFTAQLNVAVNFSCPSGSQFKPKEAAGGTSVVALDGTTCSKDVSFSELGLTATLSSPSGSKIEGNAQAAPIQYTFTVTKLPTAEKRLCYICEMPQSKGPSASNRALPEDEAGDSPPTTPCQVKIRVPADPSSSTPAPSSSSTPAPSASAPRPSIGAFVGAVPVFLGLVKTHLL